MNLPAGKALKTGLDAASIDFSSLVAELSNKKLIGFACVTIGDGSGIEEGVLVFDEGKTVASDYEYLKYGVTLFGKEAFKRIVNASNAKYGTIDVYQLTSEQLHLALSFNEQAIWVPSPNDLRVDKKSFDKSFEQQVIDEAKNLDKSELLKKYKLSDVEEKRPKTQDERELDDADLLNNIKKR
ncbi:DUF2226 domain-containing protein [Candidatus Micrarchaeota archaeon]|nr:DUF2226 domain-containing protein [Candidatus Micrarchaeota archaeon]